MKGVNLLRLTVATLLVVWTGAQNHPVVGPITGFTLKDREYEDFAAYTFDMFREGRKVRHTVEGKFWFFYYEYPGDKRDFSSLEIVRNHRAAALEQGAHILSEDEAKLDFSLPSASGATLWVRVHAWDNSYELYIIEEAALEKQLTLGVDQMRKELDRADRVAVYGIYFDFDKAELKAESQPTLQEIAKLLGLEPGLKLYVVGHTDNVGDFDYNMRLSALRAEAVVAALIRDHGIAAARLRSAGAGPLAPAASNATEEGRSLNRRVELVRQ